MIALPLSRGEVKMAIASVRSTKWRSLFTMLGVIIGVVSVVTVVSIGQGIKNQVGSQIGELSRDIITIRPGKLVNVSSDGSISSVNLLADAGNGGSLAAQDISTIADTKGVQTAVPLAITNGAVSVGSHATNSTPVLAATADLPTVLSQPLLGGNFFPADTTQQPYVAVLGSFAAKTLFHQSQPLGRTFQFMGRTFFVQGVFHQFDTNPLSLSTDFNNAVFIPYQTAQSLTNNNIRPYEVLVKPATSGQANAMVGSISTALAKAHQNQQQFTVLSQMQGLAVTNNILNLLTRMIAGIAAISLLVGGIGIMDVMLVSVTERMHEIGIRKALGATNHQILEQFMVEATVLSLTGGIIGIIVSFLVEYLLRVFTTLTPDITWQIMGLAVGVSLVVGILFGSIPALKAARKDPINALRNE